ncbi:MAG: hypothetical protein SGARI_000220 [Bacillariaceae sp.]
MRDGNGDESDGKDEVFFPRDYEEAGHITDDEIYAEFVSQIQPGVHVVALMDHCHSGSVMDLPYVCGVGEEGFHENDYFKPAMAGYVAGGAAVAGAVVAAGKKKKSKKDKKSKKKKNGEKKDSDSTGKKKKKSKDGKKKKKRDVEEAPVTTDDDEEEEDESFEEVQQEEPKKKKKGLFGFGRRK